MVMRRNRCLSGRNLRRGLLGAPRWLLALVFLAVAGTGTLIGLRSYLASLEREGGLHLSEQGNFGDAEAILMRAVKRNPRDTEVVRALALGYYSTGRDLEAETYLARWCELQPSQAEPHQRRVDCLERLGKLREAATEGERLLELEPNNSPLQKQIIIMHLKEGRYGDVERLCRRFLERQPDHAGLVYFLAEACHGQGKNDEAAALLDPLIPAQPKFAAPPMLRAILYCEANEDAKAIPLLRHVLELDRDSKTAHYHLAQALARTGQTAEAEREKAEYLRLDAFERLMTDIELQPGNLELQVKGARELLKRSRKAQAVQILRKVLTIEPTHQAAQRLLAEQ